MKIVQINATCGIGSTGKICVGISRLMNANGIENYILYSSRTSGFSLGVACSNDRYLRLQALKARVFGNYGFNAKSATRKMTMELDRIQPDIVHLHNIHGHDCDLEMLFSYFRKKKTKLIWTFHDCWAFTAYCPHFIMMKCDKWKSGCENCVQYREFSWFFDRSSELYERKKRLFSDIDLTIVTPSQWLAHLVGKSFLKNYPTEVIHNGIDLSVFKPTSGDFKQKHNLGDRKIVLGVSFGWGYKKGVDIFVKLAKMLPREYQIVLVGTNSQTDKLLPDNIISIHRTQNQQELAEIYSAADVFVNPTREENYPTVNMEALACGTPVLTFRTGGSPEIIDDTCGSVVECDDVNALAKEILRICIEMPYSKDACLKKAHEFNQSERYMEYVQLYTTEI